ncbi:hypothetical protein HY416_03965 [Candidatus Kaiserbacteria bacterium]|nr:hypothetical protein [Candidatus Kaiserbacteria bacterium]
MSQLQVLKEPILLGVKPKSAEEMAKAIFTALMSKKFRKYSVPEKNQVIIRGAIEKNIANGEPIKISWPFGGYKLWRFEETPEVDWAELFSIMYFVRWLKPVCALYQKGVEFTFWVDEVVIAKMNNIPQADLDAYQKSFADLLKFVKPWLPSNLKFEVFLERLQYESNEAFEKGLAVEMEKLSNARAASPQPLSEAAIRSIDMNVKLTPRQAQDPFWREKVDLMHYAYYNLQEQQNRIRPSYTTVNITAFTTFFEPNVIPVGTTKTSIAKFWVGVGALQRRGDRFIETIFSLSQIDKAHAVWESVKIVGLRGKNFSKIRVVG